MISSTDVTQFTVSLPGLSVHMTVKGAGSIEKVTIIIKAHKVSRALFRPVSSTESNKNSELCPMRSRTLTVKSYTPGG